MMNPPDLAAIFLEFAHRRADMPPMHTDLENLLQQAFAKGRSRWPRLDVAAAVFVSYLAQRLPAVRPEVPLEQALAETCLDDLYLACACVHRVPEAVPTLEQYCIPRLRRALQRYAPVLDDVLQDLRVHLLVGTTEAGPRLPTYRGEAGLLQWLYPIAMRMAQRRANVVPTHHVDNVLEALVAQPAPGPDAELDLLRSRFQRDFKQALRETLDALSPQERNLLRLYYLNQRTTTELGRMYDMNQSTASRWLKEVRETVYAETKRRLKERLQLSSQEFESLLNIVRSQLDMSLSQLFGEEGGGGGDLTAPREPSPAPGTSSPPP
jgi:RNA polymerase sigma-70 factor (ECF subfamily)